jgi:PadR family transcriptional regulator PadR
MGLVNAETAVLQALLRGPAFGLEVIERVADCTSGAVKIHQGNVYPTLRRLAAEGLLESYEADPLPERSGRPRVYYKLTGDGERAAREQREKIAPLFGFAPVPA